MKAPFDFVIEPKGNRYNNTKKVGDKDFVINTEITNHQFVNREARVLSVPMIGEYDIQPGDIVTVHHNVFRRWLDARGKERNSKSFFKEGIYIVFIDQIFLYKRDNEYKPTKGYSFIKPIKAIDEFNIDQERPLVGIVKYSDGEYQIEDLVGFRPGSEYEFIIDGQRLYRVMNKFITIKYEYQGNEEEYNPSWA